MSKKPLKIGIVGLGWGYLYHLKRVAEVENAEVTALADTNQVLLKKAAEENNIEETYTDAAELFESSNVDGVIIAVPNFLHEKFAVKALECGKHVCLEKPMAPTVEEASRIKEARDRTGNILMANFNQRFVGNVPQLKQIIDGGILGNFLYGKTEWTRRRGIPWGASDWFVLMEKSGGGPLIDIGVHRLDLALYLMGFPKVKRVTGNVFSGQGERIAARSGREYTVEDAAAGYIQFENGTSLVLEASWYLNCPEGNNQSTILYAENGGVMLSSLHENEVTLTLNGVALDGKVWGSENDFPKHNIDHFCRVMRGEEELVCTAEQAIEGLRIIRAVYESAETGKPVDFS
ncbi:MAG: Gfo/Idh/MocA family protein [Spirochaetia bacterium]